MRRRIVGICSDSPWQTGTFARALLRSSDWVSVPDLKTALELENSTEVFVVERSLTDPEAKLLRSEGGVVIGYLAPICTDPNNLNLKVNKEGQELRIVTHINTIFNQHLR